jgi:Tol biopolymer transport system component
MVTGRSRIASVSGRDLDIYVMDADGSNVTRLTTTPVLEMSPDWSPDGSAIAFNSQRTGGPGLASREVPGVRR